MPSLYVKKYPEGRRIERICERCDRAFSVPRRAVARGQGRFCSQGCKGEAQRSAVTVSCEVCQRPFSVRPSELAKGVRFCSWSCRLVGIRGPGNVNWSGSDPDYRGWDWPSARAAAMKRDDHRCRACGAKNGLVVHHIIYWANGGTNDLANLVTVCRSCHLRIHPRGTTTTVDADILLHIGMPGEPSVDNVLTERPDR